MKPMASPPSLVAAWRECLEREEAHLAATLEGLRAVRAALLQRHVDPGDPVWTRLEEMGRGAAAVRKDREAFRRRLAAATGLAPEEITLDRCLARDEAGAEEVRRCRARVRALAAETEAVLRANAQLMVCYLEFCRRFFEEIGGQAGAGAAYGPGGRRAAAPAGSLIRARG